MEYNPSKRQIISNKIVNDLDKFVLDFCENLKDYVIVSGYVSIVLGRSRATEDVDLLIKPLTIGEFKQLWNKLDQNGFECINTSDFKEAFNLLEEIAIRFCRKGKAVPNMEFKIAKKDIDFYSINNKIKLILKDKELFLSPLEMQIAYKLMLGKQNNKKDIEDAKHIYDLFESNLNKEELTKLIERLNVRKEFELIK
jgi:hypothetical protein